jgi:ribonuclease HII
VAAAVILPYPCDLPGVNDSKLLTPDQRERLYSQIAGLAPGIAFSVIPADTIDRINILEAAKMAMTQAVQAIDPPPDHLLIDGPISLRVDIPQQSVIKGDRMSVSIAAASVVAKVTRDRLMLELHSEFPQYGFDKHKGYPTKDHRAALLRYGPCPAHRKSFKGVKELL